MRKERSTSPHPGDGIRAAGSRNPSGSRGQVLLEWGGSTRSGLSDHSTSSTTPTRSSSDRCLLGSSAARVVRAECEEQLALSRSSSRRSLFELKDERKQLRRAMRRSTSSRKSLGSLVSFHGEAAADPLETSRRNKSFRKSTSLRSLGGGGRSDFMAQLKEDVLVHSRQPAPPPSTRKSVPAPPQRGLSWKSLNDTLNTSLRNVWSGISGESDRDLESGEDSDEEAEEEDDWLDQYYTEQYEKYQFTPADVVSLVTDEAAFRSLQRSLRKRNLVTNGFLEQNLHFYIKCIKDVRIKHGKHIKTRNL